MSPSEPTHCPCGREFPGNKEKTMKIRSLNVGSGKLTKIKTYLKKPATIYLLQEHFKDCHEIKKFKTQLRNFTNKILLIKSARKRTKRFGRNRGGLALIINNNVSFSVTHTSNFRIQSVELTINKKSLQCLNIYLPNERKRNISELEMVLKEVNKIMLKYPHPLIIGGDLNYDVSRRDTTYNKIIKNFLKINKLKLVWETNKFDVKSTYLHHNKNTSVIDHFAYRGNLKVLKGGVENTKQFGHSPIWMDFCLT